MDFLQIIHVQINCRIFLLLWLNFLINISSYFEMFDNIFALKLTICEI